MLKYRWSMLLSFGALIACNSAVTQGTGQEVESSVSMDIGHLVLEPSTLDFGDRCQGVSVDATVTLRNVGTDDVYVTEPSWSDDASTDFEVVEPESVTGWLTPGASRDMTVRYTPTGGNADDGELEVRVTQGFVGERVSVSGQEGGPSLQTSPLSVDLGAVAVGSSHTTQLMIRCVRGRG